MSQAEGAQPGPDTCSEPEAGLGSRRMASARGDAKVNQPFTLAGAVTRRFHRLLGWSGIGLGALELLSPKTITAALGVQGKEGLIQAYGAHEIGTGILLLSGKKPLGIWSRLIGDALNAALLVSALRRDNPKRGNAALALAALAGLILFDLNDD